VSFRLLGVFTGSNASINCICATDPQCQSSIFPSVASDTVPGIVAGCFVIDTLLLSTLECLYLEVCISVLYTYMDETVDQESTGIMWINAHLLIDEEESSPFAPDTSLEIIVKQMMIEQWNSSFYFDRYYDACAPTYCTYSDTAHSKNFVGILITLVSTISGLVVALRIITPQFIKLALYILQLKVKRRRRRRRRRGNYIYISVFF
jgi:hypothetical protein